MSTVPGTGLPKAIKAVSPDTVAQAWIVRLMGNSLAVIGRGERSVVARKLKTIHKAPNSQATEDTLDNFENSDTGKRFPAIAPLPVGRRRPVLRLLPGGAQDHLHTNAFREPQQPPLKTARNRAHFPSEDAAVKIIFLVLREIEAKSLKRPEERRAANPRLPIRLGGLFPCRRTRTKPENPHRPRRQRQRLASASHMPARVEARPHPT